MRVSWKWLNELIELNIEPAELARLMTMAGVEIDTIEDLNKGVQGIKVGCITEIKDHPQADKLLVCRVRTGENKELTIVTGAGNVRTGQKVPIAESGAVLAGGEKIKTTALRGIESEGMLCSAEELGLDVDKLLPQDREGIYILDENAPLGEDVVKYLNQDDVMLELELTPNRADCLSMLNVAREAAALTGGKLKLPEIIQSKEGGACAAMTSVEIKDPELCKRYVTRLIKDVRVAPSPLWLRQRLLAAGVRPISNIVDITNYVMLEMGQPLHAFDYDLLKENRIIVRKAKAAEEIVTLDGQNRILNPEMLIIADAERPVAIAGVMGGLDTEVTDDTKVILLEAAFFNGPSIRRTSQALGLRSEASLRFEKEIDLEQVVLAADRAVQLMAELGAGTPVDGYVNCFPAPEKKEPVKLRLNRVNEILGTCLDEQTVEKILVSLQIEIVEKDKANKAWLVYTPSYRRDLEREIDLIEEIARLYGYDKIPTTLPYGATTQGVKTWDQRVRQKVSSLMTAQGLYEIITFSFINPRNFDMMRVPADHPLRQAVVVKNPLSEEQGVMRTTLIPGLLDTVLKNLNKRNKDFSLYEVGKIYEKAGISGKGTLPKEKWILGAAATGKKEKTWAYPEMEYDFFYLKGLAENALAGLGISEPVFRAVTDLSWYHPGRSAAILVNGKEIGTLGEVHPLVLENYAINQRTTILVLDIGILGEEAVEGINYQPVPKYPAVTRDLAVIIPEKINAAQVEAVIGESGKELLKEISLFDLYRGKQIDNGYKSLAFSLTWQAKDRTLTDEEVNLLHHDILAKLADCFQAKIRS